MPQVYKDCLNVLPEFIKLRDLMTMDLKKEQLFTGRVLVEEKVLGTPVACGIMQDGSIVYKYGHSHKFYKPSDTNLPEFKLTQNLYEKLEILKKQAPTGLSFKYTNLIVFGVHPSSVYDKRPANDVIIHDAFLGGELMSRADLCNLAVALDVDASPLIEAGSLNISDIETCMRHKSVLKKEDDYINGVVIKNPNYYTAMGQGLCVPYYAKYERGVADQMFRTKLISFIDTTDLTDWIGKFNSSTFKHFANNKCKLVNAYTGDINKDGEILGNMIRKLISDNAPMLGRQLYRMLAGDIMGLASKDSEKWLKEYREDKNDNASKSDKK